MNCDMLFTILSFKIWLTPVITDGAVLGTKLTVRVAETQRLGFYAKLRVYDNATDVTTFTRSNTLPTITSRIEVDF